MAYDGVYAYLAHGAKRISVLALSPMGELTQIQDVPLRDGPAGDGVREGNFISLAVSPDRRFLYASNRTAPYSIRSYAINGADGSLALLGDSPTVDSAPHICTDRTGRFLLAAHNPPVPGTGTRRRGRTGFVSVSNIHDGFVQPPHQVIHTPPKPHAIVVDHGNRFVSVPACDADVLVRFELDTSTGTLNANALPDALVRPESGPRQVVHHPSNRFMYLLNETDGTVYVYSHDPATGALSELQIASVRPPGTDDDSNCRAGEMHLTPDGKWLYCAVRANCTIAALAVDLRTGLLTPVGSWPVEREPRGFGIDPLGRFLVANGLMTATATTFSIDRHSGALSRVAELSTLEEPNWIEFVRLP